MGLACYFQCIVVLKLPGVAISVLPSVLQLRKFYVAFVPLFRVEEDNKAQGFIYPMLETLGLDEGK